MDRRGLDSQLKIISKEHLKDLVCVVVGTRPGIIKMSPIVRELEKRDVPYFILHTGQHYSYDMDQKFFEALNLPKPKHHVKGGQNNRLHGQQTAAMLVGIEKALIQERPRLVLVGGDANTNLAGALAARKLQIEVGHVEAGLRSFDWRMPEEHNRIMIDHISEYLFAPTLRAKQNLVKDNVQGKVYIIGNTIVDALFYNIKIAEEKSDILEKLGLESKGFLLVTMHREENVDSRENLEKIVKVLALIKNEANRIIIFPVHPRTKKRLSEFGLLHSIREMAHIHLIPPLGYLDFLLLLMNTKLVLTDSGGIQEESCILKTPCITLRESTERQETVEIGSNIVAGLDPMNVLKAVKKMLKKKPEDWPNPFGDGRAAERIVKIAGGKRIVEWKFDPTKIHDDKSRNS